MKNFLKLILIIFLFVQVAFSAEIKFVFLTDANINAKDKTSIENFKEAVNEINSFKDVDFVVFGGNNISKSNIENLNCFIKYLKKINKKSVVLLGSNDVLSTSGVNKQYYLKRIKRALKFSHSDKANYTFKIKDYIFVVMDGSKQYFQSSNGYYNADELFWLDKTLTKFKKENVIILQHFPIVPSNSQWLTTAKLENYYEVLKNHNNVKAVVSGHYDTNDETKIKNIYNILTENFSSNSAYKIIEINLDDDFIGTYLVK